MATLGSPRAGFISAQIRYLNPVWRDSTEVPEIGDRESRRANTSKIYVVVSDARPRQEAGTLHLDTNGFVLATNASNVKDFQDTAEVEKTYYAEIESLIKSLTGADHVFISQHVVRTEDTSDFNKAYARFLHCDYSVEAPMNSAKRMLENRGISLDEGKRWEFAWYNAWQPFDRPVLKNPLTVVDAQSLAPGDVIDYRYTGFGNKELTAEKSAMEAGNSSMPIYNPDHEFCYFPNMQTSEVMVFKQLETRAGRAVVCPHTSFDDNTSPADALPRRSIEVRVMCAFGS